MYAFDKSSNSSPPPPSFSRQKLSFTVVEFRPVQIYFRVVASFHLFG